MHNQFPTLSRAREISKTSLCRSKIAVSLTLLLLSLAGAGLVLMGPRPTSAVMITPLTQGWPTAKRSWSDRVWGAMPMWVWRVKESVFGPAKRILLNAEIMDCDAVSDSPVRALSLEGEQSTEENGFQVWILPDSALDALRQRLHQMPILAQPRFDISDGVEAQMWTGQTLLIDGAQTPVGLVINFLPRLHQSSTELAATITFSEAMSNQAAALGVVDSGRISIQTNLAVTAGLQIPKGHGVFLLDRGHALTNGKRLGVIISAHVPAPKK